MFAKQQDENESGEWYEAVLFNVVSLRSKKVLESIDIFTGDMRYICDGRVVVYSSDEGKLGMFAITDEGFTFRVLDSCEDESDGAEY